MSKNRRKHRCKEYKRDHSLAKFIVACTVSSLLLIGVSTGHVLFDILAVWVWIFGVNPLAKFIELVCNHKSKHNWL